MKKNFYRLLIIVILICAQPIKALKTKNWPNGFKEQQTTSISFTENKGQVRDQNYNPRPDVLFGGSANGMAYHLRNNGISYQLNRVDSWKKEERQSIAVPKEEIEKLSADQTTIYRLDINWLGINNKFTIQTEKPFDGCSNYYLTCCPNGISNVKSYQGVFYNNIYNNINLHYYQKNGALKYDYIIAPGGDYKQIQLEIKGAENIVLQKDGSIFLKTPLGIISEASPIVFQNGKQLNSNWVVVNNVLSFSVTNYNPKLELIIDPATRLWATYYGGAVTDYPNSCTTDSNGNVFLAGETDLSTGTIIATAGSHQSAFGGGTYDAFLVKFNSNGIRQWSTFYGGAGYDCSNSCATDANGNAYLAGYTNTNAGTVIATAGSHQSAFGGGTYDAFLVKFNSNGIRQWSTYYGSTGYDVGNCCITDANGNVYLAGYTDANTGTVIATAGSHQSAFGGGTYDAFLVKFNSAGIRQWGTYYGGAGYDKGNSCTTDVSGNVYLAGVTASNTGTIIATTGSHQSIYGGGVCEGFLVKLNNSGNRQWCTYYGSTVNYYGYSCICDALGNVYLAGTTTSATGTVITTAGSHQSAYGGGTFDAFLAKFNAAGVRQWGTYYGGNDNDLGHSCTTDADGNVYLGGNSYSNTGTIIATADAFQSVNGGNVDAYLVKFNSTGIRQWGTYYGGVGDDYGLSCKSDGFGNVFLAGPSSSTAGTVIATVGSHQDTYSGNTDAFLVKLTDCAALNVTATANSSLCAGASINFTVSITGTSTPTYSWAGPNSFTSAIQNPTIAGAGTVHTGIYSVTVNNSGCIETDSIMITVSVCAGIQNLFDNSANFNVYPNPNNGLFCVELNSTAQVTVLNIIGQVLINKILVQGKNNIDLRNQVNGIYFVKITRNGNQKTLKLIKE